MSVYAYIAFHEGSLGTVWGPCSDGRTDPCECPQCRHANELSANGKDWNTEYRAAKQRGFYAKERSDEQS